jgi:hypothetical protein
MPLLNSHYDENEPMFQASPVSINAPSGKKKSIFPNESNALG